MSEFVVGESVFVDEALTDFEAMRVFFEVVEERGHGGLSAVVDDHGKVVSHPDYVDRMGAAHVQAGAWAFCRRPAAEALGLPSGTDWVRDCAVHLMFSGGSPYRPAPHLYDQLYIQQFGSTESQLMTPVCAASAIAWNTAGTHICVMEERLGPLTDGSQQAKCVLWEYELALGHRRVIASFPPDMKLGFADLSYSRDNKWVHIGDWGFGRRNLLVRIADGLVVPLPWAGKAVSWNPRLGPSMLTSLVPLPDTGALAIHDYDLSSGESTSRGEIRSTTGLPLEARELSISTDGLALLVAPIGAPNLEQLRRGGVQIAAVSDLDDRTIEPAIAVRYRTQHAQRRHNSPRWCEDSTPAVPSPTVVHDRLLESGYISQCEPDGPEIAHDHLGRWLEVLDGIERAWSTKAMPTTRFAQDFTQTAIRCAEADETATDNVLERLRVLAEREPTARAVLRSVADGYRRGSPLTALTLPSTPPSRNPDDESSDAEQRSATEARLEAVYEQLAAAGNSHQAANTIQQLLYEARRAHQTADRTWEWLTALSDAALRAKSYRFAATTGLITQLWNGFFLEQDPNLVRSGLNPTPPNIQFALFANAFEACTHLPERQILARDNNSVFDVENVRNWSQGALSQLPVDEYLLTQPRPTRPPTTPPAVGNPATSYNTEAETHHVAKQSTFISYVREDSETIDRIAATLRDNGIEVWLDRTHIEPGERWQGAIRRAIRNGTHFVACFSVAYATRNKSYAYEELRQAITELRQMPFDRRWFIPILLEPCTVPEIDIDSVDTIDSIQRIDFSQDWDTAIRQLIKAITTR